MLLGEHEQPAGAQQPVCLSRHRGKVRHVVHGQGAGDQVEGAFQRVQLLHGQAAVLHARVGVLLLGQGQHLFGDVDAQHPFRAAANELRAMVPRAAAQVQHGLARQIRQKRQQRRGLEQHVGVVRLLPKAAVAFEEHIVVVDVLQSHIPFSSFRITGARLQLVRSNNAGLSDRQSISSRKRSSSRWSLFFIVSQSCSSLFSNRSRLLSFAP